METVTLHARMRFILLPTEGIRNSNGKGVQKKAISKGEGSDSQGLFSGDFETRKFFIVFIDDLTLTIIAECFLSQLTCIIVYMYLI